MKNTGLLLLLLFPAVVFAQKVDTELYSRLRSEYPEDQVVFLKNFQDVDIRVKNGQLIISNKVFEERAHLGDQSAVYARDRVYSNSFYDIQDLEARTLVPAGRKYNELEVTDFKESFDKDSYIFYDDSKIVNFIYPGVESGALTQVEYTEISKEPRFGESFYFQSFIPVDHSRFSVTADNSVKLDFRQFNTEAIKLKVTEEPIRGERTKYTFEAYQVPTTPHEDRAPKISFYGPHIAMRITEYASGGQTVKVLESPSDLYNWYRTFLKDLKPGDGSDELKKIVSTLLAPEDTTPEKVEKIFYWVQDNIKYIAFEDGMRGFIPHPGSYVCEKRYGDCKDMASIIVNMLELAGVEAYYTWIGTRDIPYSYSELPSPIVDNHMIASYKYNGVYYFLDGTAQYLTYPLPSSMIQGKEALVARGDSFEIVNVPVMDETMSQMIDTVRLTLDNGKIRGEGHVFLSGYARMFNAYRMIKTDQKEVKDYLTRLLAKGNNKFLIEDYDILHLENRDVPITVDYDFTVADYYRQIGDEIYINLHLDKSFLSESITDERMLPLENEYKYTNKTVSILEIPEGYTTGYIPENMTFENDLFAFTVNYVVRENRIILDKTFRVKYLLMQPEDFNKWNKAIDQLNLAYREALTLRKTD